MPNVSSLHGIKLNNVCEYSRLLNGKLRPVVDVIPLGATLEQPIEPVRQAVQQISLEQHLFGRGIRIVRVETDKCAAFAVFFAGFRCDFVELEINKRLLLGMIFNLDVCAPFFYFQCA